MTDVRENVSSFRRMDESTAEHWGVIGTESIEAWGLVPDRVLALLRSLADIRVGFAVDQLTHSLQTATRAERAGADDEVIVAALCHDIGKAISEPNHPAVAAALLKPFVGEDVSWMIQVHQDFQGKHYYQHFGKDPDAREQYRDHPHVRSSPSGSPTSGTRRRSTPTTTRCRSSTSSRWCARSSARRGRSGRPEHGRHRHRVRPARSGRGDHRWRSRPGRRRRRLLAEAGAHVVVVDWRAELAERDRVVDRRRRVFGRAGAGRRQRPQPPSTRCSAKVVARSRSCRCDDQQRRHHHRLDAADGHRGRARPGDGRQLQGCRVRIAGRGPAHDRGRPRQHHQPDVRCRRQRVRLRRRRTAQPRPPPISSLARWPSRSARRACASTRSLPAGSTRR